MSDELPPLVREEIKTRLCREAPQGVVQFVAGAEQEACPHCSRPLGEHTDFSDHRGRHSYQPDNTRVPAGVAVVVAKFPVGFITPDEPLPEDVPLLVIQRTGSHGDGTWALPGGFVSTSDAQLIDAASRELWEEVGLRSSIFRYMGTRLDHYPDRDPVVCSFFLSLDTEGDGARNTNPDRIRQVSWLTKYELKRMRPATVFTPLREALASGIL